MKTSIDIISDALDSYYGGMPLDSIQRNLEQQYSNRFAESGIYNWIVRFSKTAAEKASTFHPKVGDTWIADETVMNVGGKNIWFWDIIDTKTRFLLASHISETRTAKDAEMLMQQAYMRAGKAPKVILTDKLAAYLDGIELTFGNQTKHVQSKPFTSDNSTNIIERFHGTIKERTKIVRGFKRMDKAKIITDAWLVHYNFFKEHTSLGDIPPAQNMGLDTPFKNWHEVITGKTTTEHILPKSKIPTRTKIYEHKRHHRRKPKDLQDKQYTQVSLVRAINHD
jgi:transposase-like protein